MKKKVLLNVIILSLLLAVFAACGGSDHKKQEGNQKQEIHDNQVEVESEYASMEAINDFCESDEAKMVVDSFLETYVGAFSEMRMYSPADGVLIFTYKYKNQQEYDKPMDEVAKEQRDAIANLSESIEEDFKKYDAKDLKLNAFEYVYYNADGTVIADVTYRRGGEITSK